MPCVDTSGKIIRVASGPETTIDEIAEGIFRFSTWIPGITEHGFTFNQFLLTGEQPFGVPVRHAAALPAGVGGHRQSHRARTAALDFLRPRGGGRMRGGEPAARGGAERSSDPQCASLHGLSSRHVRQVAGGRPDDAHDIGGHRLRFIATPHVPHNWESGLWFDETTSTLLCGDLLEHAGRVPAVTESDCVGTALESESLFQATGRTTNLAPTLEQLARLRPRTPAIMHGAAFSGDGAAQLRALSDGLSPPESVTQR